MKPHVPILSAEAMVRFLGLSGSPWGASQPHFHIAEPHLTLFKLSFVSVAREHFYGHVSRVVVVASEPFLVGS